jgi:ribonuclease VapC
MILDTSAVIAIIQRQPSWQQIRSQLEQATLPLNADVVPVDEDLARRACQIFQRFGKGQGHGSQLHFGDCFAAALADRDQCPLACVGEDFRAAGF